MTDRREPFPYERMVARIAIAILQRGEILPPNTAAACAIGLARMVRDVNADPCPHDSYTGGRCDECGEYDPSSAPAGEVSSSSSRPAGAPTPSTA